MADANLMVSVGADVDPLVVGLKKATKETGKFREQINTGAKDFAKYTAAAGAAGLAIGAALVSKSMEAIDVQAKLAQQLNTTSESIANLDRAGQLSGVSMEQISAASRNLTVRLGEAEQGVKSSSDALKRLQLDAGELAQLPLDQRIQKINQALRDNVPITERAAVAADLFGSRNATAIQQLQPGVIEQASKEVELFGLALDDVDAAKVEMANDAMSTIGMAFDGVIQQVAVQLAPLLQALADKFKDAAEEGDGFADDVGGAMNGVISAIGFVLDAIEGIKRTFKVVADGIIVLWAEVSNKILEGALLISEGLDYVPGMDMSVGIKNLSDQIAMGEAVIAAAKDNIDATLNEPMPSEGLKKWVADVKEAADEAAQAVVDSRVEAIPVPEVPETGGGMSKEEQGIANKLATLQSSFDTELEMLQKKLADEQQIIEQALAAKQLTQEEASLLSQDIAQRHQDALNQIEMDAAKERADFEKQQNASRLAAASGILGDLSSLMQTENKKQFKIGKQAAIAQAVISTITSAQEAYKALAGIPVVGPALGAAAAAAATAAGYARVNQIRSQSFQGGGSASGAAGGGGVSAPQAQTVQGNGESTGANLFVQGLNPTDLFSGAQVVDIINEAQEQGAVLRVAQ